MTDADPHLLGLRFDPMTLGQAADWIGARSAETPFGYVVTPNADHLVRLGRFQDLRGPYQSASLCLLDSRVVRRLARMIGLRPPPVVTGSDLTEVLLRTHLRPGERITIVGMTASEVAALARRFALTAPAHHNPPMGFEHDPVAFRRAVDFVLAHPARFIFLAVGSPRQERLAHAIAATGLASGTGLCIGASLSFAAGTRRRAPVWMRRAGLEWLFRLGCEPRRLWRRYLCDGPAIVRLLLRARRDADGMPDKTSHRSRVSQPPRQARS